MCVVKPEHVTRKPMIEVTAAVMQIVIQHVSDSGYLVDLQELSFLVFGLVLLVYFDLNQIVCVLDVVEQICTNCVMHSRQYRPISRKNVSSTLLNPCHREYCQTKAFNTVPRRSALYSNKCPFLGFFVFVFLNRPKEIQYLVMFKSTFKKVAIFEMT